MFNRTCICTGAVAAQHLAQLSQARQSVQQEAAQAGIKHNELAEGLDDAQRELLAIVAQVVSRHAVIVIAQDAAAVATYRTSNCTRTCTVLMSWT